MLHVDLIADDFDYYFTAGDDENYLSYGDIPEHFFDWLEEEKALTPKHVLKQQKILDTTKGHSQTQFDYALVKQFSASKRQENQQSKSKFTGAKLEAPRQTRSSQRLRQESNKQAAVGFPPGSNLSQMSEVNKSYSTSQRAAVIPEISASSNKDEKHLEGNDCML